jgi:hypothetical protein
MNRLGITFLYFADCPSHVEALARLKDVLKEENLHAPIEVIRVDSQEQAQALRFFGSPTIRINGRDIVPPPPQASYHLACRAYHLEDGRISPLPSVRMIREGLRRAAQG